MKRKFFIFSLPRSGSCWLSNLLSLPGSYCYHEPLVADMTWPLLLKRMEARPEFTVGAIDTDFHNRAFLPIDGAHYFVLRRDLNAVFRSQINAYMTTWDGDLKGQVSKLERHAKVSGATEINYERLLRDFDYVREVWTMVTGLPFDEERAMYLTEMNIQRMPAGIVSRQLAAKAGLKQGGIV